MLLTAIPRADRKWLAEIFDWFVEKLEVSPASTGLEHLCPHCYETVEGRHPPACPACAVRFKLPKRAGRLSLVFPGAGELYLGHNWFAVFELIGATFVWAVLIVMAVDPTVPFTVMLLAKGAVVVVVPGADAWTTRRIARKGLIGDPSRDVRWHFALAGLLPTVALITAVAAATAEDSLGLIYVVPETDEAFLLLVSRVAGGDTIFVGELLDRWRAVRSQGTGVWFDGGGGTSLDDAVVMHGVDTPEQIDDAERWWLNTWVGQMDTELGEHQADAQRRSRLLFGHGDAHRSGVGRPLQRFHASGDDAGRVVP